MPYSRKARYRHFRKKKPKEFKKGTFRIVPITHTNYKGKWSKIEGTKAVVGKTKKNNEWKIQSILVPKKYFKKRGKKK